MNDWPELDAFVAEQREQHAERWQQIEEVRRQFQQIGPRLQSIKRQFGALQVQELLEAINERLLGGLGTLELMQSGVGFEYVAALAWPSFAGPRLPPSDRTEEGDAEPPAEHPEEEGICRIEVWLGPGGEDAKPRVRISGAKRLEAPLPTSSDRFRGALLQTVRNPFFVPRQAEAEPTGSAGAPKATSEPAPDGEAEPDQPDQSDSGEKPATEPPKADEPIAMGPAHEAEPPALN